VYQAILFARKNIPKFKTSFGVICFGVQATLQEVMVMRCYPLLSNLSNNSKDFNNRLRLDA
jgi:hypothetical protein